MSLTRTQAAMTGKLRKCLRLPVVLLAFVLISAYFLHKDLPYTETKNALRVDRKCPVSPLRIFADPDASFRENLGLFVEEKVCQTGVKARVLEIGVWQGTFSEALLQRFHTYIEEYVMIEPAKKLTGSRTPELDKRLLEFPLKYPGVKVRLIDEISVIAARQFPDRYFDWVYCDGLHTYRGVSDDIASFWDKLKEGGLFAGHDFSMSKKHAKADRWNTIAPWSGMRAGVEKAGFPGSYKAVVEHSRKHGIQVFHTLEGRYGESMWGLSETGDIFRNNPSWFMFKHVDPYADYKVDTENAVAYEYVWDNGILQRKIRSIANSGKKSKQMGQ